MEKWLRDTIVIKPRGAIIDGITALSVALTVHGNPMSALVVFHGLGEYLCCNALLYTAMNERHEPHVLCEI
jgi:hypothetical protein